ncbi:MAG: PQQ-binding-like beta-propeller repeat protein [Planctomycetes bacterium]|nr:PQQ-binding-like beta-propeller repeat protein [Planctomycetota bacterium]
MHLKKAVLSIGVLVCATSAVGAEVPAAVGWRGDGNGRYPQATPPLHWSRVSKSVLGLAAQAAKPKSPDAAPAAGTQIPDGTIHKWLVLGPLPLADDKKLDDETLANEAAVSPDENEKAGELAWKAVAFDDNAVDFNGTFNLPGKKPKAVAYAHTYLYSADGKPLSVNFMYESFAKVWLNGKPAFSHPNGGNLANRFNLAVAKGWNRILIKSQTSVDNWYVRATLFGPDPNEVDAKGIVWITRMPNLGYSSPIVVGDKIFATIETGGLCCMNKADGKILWVRSATYYDTASDEERKANAQAFTEMDALAAQLKQADDATVNGAAKKTDDERAKLEDQLNKAMAKVDKKYRPAPRGEAGFTAPNPVSDGERVYVAYGTGVTVCYDLAGNKKWSDLSSHPDLEHGYNSSPLLADGKLIIYMGECRALDPKTGKLLWESPRFLPENNRTYYHFHGSGCVLSAGTEKVAFFLNGEFVRLSDGKNVYADFWKLGDSRYSAPVVDRGMAYKVQSGTGGVVAFKPSAISGDKLTPEIVNEVKFDTNKYPKFYLKFYNAAPLYHEGLLYCIDEDAVLTVVDMEKGEVAYQKLLDLDLYMHHNFGAGRGGAAASPTLAGKYIYLFGNQGSSVVIEPGRTFKQVAKNRLEQIVHGAYSDRQEVTITCPVFEGARMYYRGEQYLYCIEEKK